MKLLLEEIPEGVSNLEITCSPTEIDLESDGIYFSDPVIAKLKLFKQIDKVFIKAELSVAIDLECARCLSPIHIILKGSFENQYRPMPKIQSGIMDDIGIAYYTGDYIELSDDFRESLLLEIPIRILCSENCKGLCPKCGQNLNEGKCDCKLEFGEVQKSKFALLAKILETKK